MTVPSVRATLEPGPCPKCGCDSYIAGEPYWKHDNIWSAAACVTCDKCEHEWDVNLVLATPPAPTPSAVRERIARIIYPDGFCREPNPDESKLMREARRQSAFAKADAILALLPDAAAIRATAFEEAAGVADCLADEYDATSFTSTNAEQVGALRSKEQAAHEIAAAIRAAGEK